MSDPLDRSPELANVLDLWRLTTKRELRVSLPCVVQRYDPATQTVDVQPQVQESTTAEDGTVVPLVWPVIPHVPVAFPGGGGFRVTFPLQPGDTGTLLFADRSIDLWQQQGGSAPAPDERRHHLADAQFIPGIHPDNAAWTGARTDATTWGKDGGPQVTVTATDVEVGGNTDAITKGSTQDAALRTLINALDVFLGAVNTFSAGALTTPYATWQTAKTAYLAGAYLSSIAKVG